MKTKNKKIILPIVIGREGKWFVVSCPVLNIATQGKTEKEAKENIKALIEEYLKDPDTLKPDFSKIIFPFLSYIETTIKT
jgi:predicted RNase H-like HicB family nuclease